MLSEQQYREVVAAVCEKTPWSDDQKAGANWNNDFILRLAIHGLFLLPKDGDDKPPFSHYITAPLPASEPTGDGQTCHVAWRASWIADGDYKDHLKEQVRFTFTPLTKA